MRKTIQAALPHLVILICNMYIVFFLIDRVNKAMNFIDNGLTKGLLLALCLIGLGNAGSLSRGSRRRQPGVQASRGRREARPASVPRMDRRRPGSANRAS